MVIKNAKIFNIGALFAVTFIMVLIMIFSPLFKGKNGLEFADSSFNKLAKGSSYFIPKVAKDVEKVSGKQLQVSITFDSAEDAADTAKLFAAAGATATTEAASLRIDGNLGAVLTSALNDADAMYQNNGKAVADRYGMNEKKALKSWWTAFSKIEKKMKKDKLIDEAKVVSTVMKKGIEPGYNFYEIDANKVADHAGMLTGLLVFYVFYTMWWGYAIFYMFEGVGLTMKKAKVKKEA